MANKKFYKNVAVYFDSRRGKDWIGRYYGLKKARRSITALIKKGKVRRARILRNEAQKRYGFEKLRKLNYYHR